MTGRAEGDLAELIGVLCQVRGPSIAGLLGTSGPSELSTELVRIAPTRFGSYAAIELRPWSFADYGIAIPELTDGAAWSLPALEELLGPLAEGPRAPGEGMQLHGFVDDPELPARAAVTVSLAGDDRHGAVAGVRIRIEPR